MVWYVKCLYYLIKGVTQLLQIETRSIWCTCIYTRISYSILLVFYTKFKTHHFQFVRPYLLNANLFLSWRRFKTLSANYGQRIEKYRIGGIFCGYLISQISFLEKIIHRKQIYMVHTLFLTDSWNFNLMKYIPYMVSSLISLQNFAGMTLYV